MAKNFTETYHVKKKKKFSTKTSDNLSIFIIKNKFLCTIIILINSIWFNKLYFFDHNTEEFFMAENFTEEIHWKKKKKFSTITYDNLSIFINQSNPYGLINYIFSIKLRRKFLWLKIWRRKFTEIEK